MDLKEVVWEDVGWIYVALNKENWRSFVSTVMNLQIRSNSWNFLNSFVNISFSVTPILISQSVSQLINQDTSSMTVATA